MRATEFITESKLVVYDGVKLDVAIDGANVDIRVIQDNNQIGYVVFDRDGKTLVPMDIAIDEEHRGKGIAKKIYDYVKSLGFTIRASSDQTVAGQSFWKKHRGEERVWEDENLTELFQQGKNWKWEFRGSEEAFASFKIGDVEYLWYARVMRASAPKQWTIGFKQRDSEFDYDKEFGLAGTGNSAEVMSTVVDITRTFLSDYGDKVEEIRFTSAEPSRTKLYARMIKRLLPNWDLHTKMIGGQAGFYLINPKAYEL